MSWPHLFSGHRLRLGTGIGHNYAVPKSDLMRLQGHVAEKGWVDRDSQEDAWVAASYICAGGMTDDPW